MKHSLSSLIKNSGKIVKKTIRVATAISESEQNDHVIKSRAKFNVSFKALSDSYENNQKNLNIGLELLD
jgi:hypothetical protein